MEITTQVVSVAIVTLLIALVGVSIISDTTEPLYTCTAGTTNLTMSNISYVAAGCSGTLCTSYPDSIRCNSNTLTTAIDYTLNANCSILLLNSTFNNTNCALSYYYEGTEYLESSTLRNLMPFLAILFGIGILVLAAFWAMR